MCKGKSLWIYMTVVTLAFASAALSQDRNRDPAMRQRDDDRMRSIRLRLRRKMDALLPPFGEHIGRHCALDEAAQDRFRAAVFESLNTMLEQDGMRTRGMEYLLTDDLTLVEKMLSKPDFRGAFAKSLSEKQLQDYMELTHTRRKLDQQAVCKQVVALLGRSLSLTAHQRVRVERAILAAGDESEVRISSLAWTGANLGWDVMGTTSGLRLPLPDVQLDGILTPVQARVWALMSAQGNEQDNRAGQEGRGTNRRNEDPRLARYRAAEAEFNRAVEAGRMTREQANERLIGLRQRLWADNATARQNSDAPESEDRVRQLAEAQLAAHTEQLGQLDARAAKRLRLAAKGTVEQVLESRATGPREEPTNAPFEGAAVRIREAVATGRIRWEQAAVRLEAMRPRGSDARSTTAPVDVTGHPLYQETIKDVLSAEAYARYQARQAEGLAFRQQAARDVVVAGLDLQLWLGEKQRKHFEQAAAKLCISPEDATIPTPAEMVGRLHDHFSRAESAVLSSWQTQQFEAIRTGHNR